MEYILYIHESTRPQISNPIYPENHQLHVFNKFGFSMTLTQVSTWFANARRRLKKENRVTWENRGTDENDIDVEDSNDGI